MDRQAVKIGQRRPFLTWGTSTVVVKPLFSDGLGRQTSPRAESLMGPWVRLVAFKSSVSPYVWERNCTPGFGGLLLCDTVCLRSRPVGTAQGPCLVSQIPADMVPQRHLQTLACHSFAPRAFSGLLARNQLICEHFSLRGSWLWVLGGQRFLELQRCFNTVSASLY